VRYQAAGEGAAVVIVGRTGIIGQGAGEIAAILIEGFEIQDAGAAVVQAALGIESEGIGDRQVARLEGIRADAALCR